MGLSKSEVRCNAHDMACQAVDAIKEHFKEYPATKPDRDALYEALTGRWIRENLIAACAREVEEWSAVITTHAHTLHDNHPKILAFYKSLDESTAHLHVDKEELQKELKLNTPLLHREWVTHEMETWYTRSLAKLYRTPDFRKLMAKPLKIDVDMYEQSTCLDPPLSDDDGDDDGDDSSSDSDSDEERGEEEEMTSEEEDESAESEEGEEEDDDGDEGSLDGDPPPKRARRERSDDDSDA
jgi:hypothetical protein